MKCLQCKKSATAGDTLDGVTLYECADGHRTGQLTAKQENEIIKRLGLALDEIGEVMMTKRTKRFKSTMPQKQLDAVANIVAFHPENYAANEG